MSKYSIRPNTCFCIIGLLLGILLQSLRNRCFIRTMNAGHPCAKAAILNQQSNHVATQLSHKVFLLSIAFVYLV